MSVPRIPSQRGNYKMLAKRIDLYSLLLQSIFDDMNRKYSEVVSLTDYNGESEFKFSEHPSFKDTFRRLQNEFVEALKTSIYSATSNEWKESNLRQDLIADKVLSAYRVKRDGIVKKIYYQTNSDALKAFQERRIGGMNLSQRVWNISEQYKSQLEDCISAAVQRGMSAVTLSKRISKYLKDYDKLKADYKEKFGKACKPASCEYRSIRLARSEINMAYREAEQTRWNQMDFVLGYDIKTTQNGKHKDDMCDMLAGRYPKWFEWNGWHPNCMCYEVPVLMSEEDFFSGSSSEKDVTDLPNNFKKWIVNNTDRINKAISRGTQPFFIKNNPVCLEITGDGFYKISSGSFAKTLKEVSKKIVRQQYEHGLIINDKGTVLLERVGNTDSIYFDDDEILLMKGNTFVHNHPSGNGRKDFGKYAKSFSGYDLVLACQADVKRMFAISNGCTYIISRGENGWGYNHKAIMREYDEIYQKLLTWNFDYHYKWENIIQHMVVKRLAKKYGFKYEKEIKK